MKVGVVSMGFARGDAVAAPESGVRVGAARAGPVTLRLFRISGTRVVVAANLLPAQLLALRVSASGTPVHVVTTRGRLWEPMIRHGSGCEVLAPGSPVPTPGGPTLLIDDCPAESRGPSEVRPWLCRVDVRSQWTSAELGAFAHADLVVFGAVPFEASRRIASVFGVARQATEPMGGLDPRSFAVVRQGRIEYFSLDPSPAEDTALDVARG